MAHTPRFTAAPSAASSLRSARHSSDRPAVDIPANLSDVILQEFAAFGDTVMKLTDATVLLEYSRERREFYLLIGPSEEEERGASTAVPFGANPAPPPPTPPQRAPVVPVHTAFLHLPGARQDN